MTDIDRRRGGGFVRRVNGPLVEVTGVPGVSVFELVELGADGIPAETVGISDGVATLQAYEHTGGLRVGDRAVPVGHPLTATLGPGLLGQVFDGLLRPLSQAPEWLTHDALTRQRTRRRWPFTPTTEPGRQLSAGAEVGIVADSGLRHCVLVPPGVGGSVSWVAAAGEYDEDTAVAVVGGHDVTVAEHWPVRVPRPFTRREDGVVPLHTGQRVLDLLFPVGRGSAAAVPGGFGTGKTVLLQQIAKWCDAGVIVYVGCGERGNEMAEVLGELAELTDPRTGGLLLDRTVIVANTSNMPMMAREASIYTAMTVAEYFRDVGHDVVVIADSTSRWAEARREFASRMGDLPAEEGYPADLASALAAFYERSGRVRTLRGTTASVTVVGAVSPPGGDVAEPVTTATQRFTQSFWSLDRDLAYARHYPAVSWADSFSRETEAVAAWHARSGDSSWARRRARAADLLTAADRLADLAEIVGRAALPGRERVVLLAGQLLREVVLMQNALSGNDAYCGAEKGTALLQAVIDVIDRCMGMVDAGTPATAIEEFDFGPLVRVRDDAAPTDVDTVHRRRDEVLRMLDELR